MTMEKGPEPNLATQPHLLDWLEDSLSFIPSFLDEPYTETNLNAYEWWNLDDGHVNQTQIIQTPASSIIPTTSSATTTPLTIPKSDCNRKRKQPGEHITRTQQSMRRSNTDNEERGTENDEEVEVQRKIGRKVQAKGNGSGSGTNGSKEARWAEQLLNPCAAAIDAANLSRVQHLLYVLHELASPSGDANHRLAYHGHRALIRHLSSTGLAAAIPNFTSTGDAPSLTTTEPKLFRSALIKFHEISPWFAFPNALANASILQAPTLETGPKTLHIVDIGVSHGIQWPTLLEALTRRPGGAPSLVKLTIAGSTAPPCPFSSSPPGYDFPSHLLRYAKSIDLSLQITQTDTLTSIVRSTDETLIISSQFRAHSGLLHPIRDLNPDLVILTALDDGASGGGFERRTGMLWRFLESTSAAFKGRECAERRVVEGEAARVLEGGFGDGREERKQRMQALGFVEMEFGDEAVDTGRALLRKYDGNWEMKAAESALCLAWKGQSVSFCSLWKVAGARQSR